MKKRGQISIVIIIGAFLLVLSGLGYMLISHASNMTNEKSVSEEDVLPAVEQFTLGCLKQTADNALLLAGLQGGYIYGDYDGVDYGAYKIPFNYYYRQDTSPILLEVEFDHLGAYVENEINTCLQNYSAFPYDFKFELLSVDVNVKDNYVYFDMKFPITVIAGDKEMKLKDFDYQAKTPFGKDFKVMEDILTEQINDPNWLPSFDYGVNVSTQYFNENITIYHINNNGYDFLFAAYFEDDFPPELLPFGNYTAKVGVPFEEDAYWLDFEDDNVTCYSVYDIIPISESGFINVTFDKPGEYVDYIRAYDSFGNYDEEEIRVVVQ